jgi:predicted nucleic acid-binding Zn ribbon protein
MHAVDKGVDTVDNFRRSGDEQRGRPSTGSRRPPAAGSGEEVVPRPGDEARPTVGREVAHSTPPANPPDDPDRANIIPRGADLAREALRAAREASAARHAARAERSVERRPRSRRRRWSGPGPDDRDPQPLGRLVARVSLDRGWSPRLTDATVLGRWPQLVGADIADHCAPLSLRDGELVLQAESTAWATQLRTLQRELLYRIAVGVGRDVVRRIRVVGPSGPSWRHGPRHVRGRGPRDTYG